MRADMIMICVVGLCMCVLISAISYYSVKNSDNNLELAKAGLEQCRETWNSQPIWVKSCTEYINARKGN